MKEPPRRDTSGLDDGDKKLLADVEQYGWQCLHVSDEGEIPEWTYTIGIFGTWQHPELLVFGLEDVVAHALLTELVNRIDEGETLMPGRDYDDVLEGYRCCFLRVDPKWYSDFLGAGQRFYETADDFPVLQVVWPDKQGRYPWERGYAVPADVQPVLGGQTQRN